MHRLPQGGLSVAKNDQAKMYGKNKELLIIGREKAYGLWKKAPFRTRKEIGRQALWPQKAKFRKVFSVLCPQSSVL
jgi:hypothetical protein